MEYYSNKVISDCSVLLFVDSKEEAVELLIEAYSNICTNFKKIDCQGEFFYRWFDNSNFHHCAHSENLKGVYLRNPISSGGFSNKKILHFNTMGRDNLEALLLVNYLLGLEKYGGGKDEK